MIVDCVPRNPVDPRDQQRFAAIRGDRLEYRNEGLLNDFLGVCVISQSREAEVVDALEIAAIEQVERVVIRIPDRHDEFVVGRIRLRFGFG